jgi:hypothetical protein
MTTTTTKIADAEGPTESSNAAALMATLWPSNQFLSGTIEEENVDEPCEEGEEVIEFSVDLSLLAPSSTETTSPTTVNAESPAIASTNGTTHTTHSTTKIRKRSSYIFGKSQSMAALDAGPSSPISVASRRAVTPNPVGTHTPLLTPPSSSFSLSRIKLNKARGGEGLFFNAASPPPPPPPPLVAGIERFRRKSIRRRQAEDPVRRPNNHYRDPRKSINESIPRLGGDDLKINKLQFASLGLYARDTEKELLLKCLTRMMEGSETVVRIASLTPSVGGHGPTSNVGGGEGSSGFFPESVLHERPSIRSSSSTTSHNNNYHHHHHNNTSRFPSNTWNYIPRQPKQLVFVSGYSGTGKTALATAIERDVWKAGGIFMTGKFDLYLRDEPYTGIVSACEELCSYMIRLFVGPINDPQKTNSHSSSIINHHYPVFHGHSNSSNVMGDDAPRSSRSNLTHTTNNSRGSNNTRTASRTSYNSAHSSYSGGSSSSSSSRSSSTRNCNTYEHLSKRTPADARMVLLNMIEELGDELAILTRVIPQLRELLGHVEGEGGGIPMEGGGGGGEDGTTNSDANPIAALLLEEKEDRHQQQPGYLEAKNRFNYAFKRFIRVLGGCFSPLVLVLDDLQWADFASVSLFFAFLVLFTY